MIRVLAFAALILGVGWWVSDLRPAWHRSGSSTSELTAALSACRAEATAGLRGIVPSDGHAIDRCMTGRGWALGEAPSTQVAALR
jgi:hypothetical protein